MQDAQANLRVWNWIEKHVLSICNSHEETIDESIIRWFLSVNSSFHLLTFMKLGFWSPKIKNYKIAP